MAAQPDTLGHYKVQRVLGKGAMGVVYEGFDARLHRRVAIKTIQKTAFGDWSAHEYSSRFLREAQAVARLNHPNIVQVYDFGEDSELSFIVMEFIDGKDLKSYLEESGRFPLKDSLRIICELLDALDLAHQAGVVHRDIKPANVMLDNQRRTKLTDFGVARLTDQDRTRVDTTQIGTIVGTPAYMSPEQILGQKIDGRSDIFSAGVLLYELLTGRKPFEGGAYTLARMIIEADPAPASTLERSLSPELDRIIFRTLAKAPENRFSTAREVAGALRRFLESGAAVEFDDGSTVLAPAAFTGRADSGARRIEEFTRPGDREQQTKPPSGEADLEFWRSIKDSDDPEDLELYVQKFPGGIYVDLAKRKISKLRRFGYGSPRDEDSGMRSTQFDEEYWRSIKDSDQPDDLELYLKKFPRGAFAELARRKLVRLGQGGGYRDEQRSGASSPFGAIGPRRDDTDPSGAEEWTAMPTAEEEERHRAERRGKREAEEQARRAAAEKAARDALQRQREAEEALTREAEARAKREAEAAAKREAEAAAKREAEARARREAEAAAKREAEAAAKREAEARARREAEAEAKREAEARARREAEESAAREHARQQAELAKQQAAQQALREAEAREKREAKERSRREAEERAREKREAEEVSKREAEERSRREAEQRAERQAKESAARELARQQAQVANEAATERANREAITRARQESAEKARRNAEVAGDKLARNDPARGKRRPIIVAVSIAALAAAAGGLYFATQPKSPNLMATQPSGPAPQPSPGLQQPPATVPQPPAMDKLAPPGSRGAPVQAAQPAGDPSAGRPAQEPPEIVTSPGTSKGVLDAPTPGQSKARTDDRLKREVAKRDSAQKAAKDDAEKARREAEQRQELEARRAQVEKAEQEAQQRQKAETAKRDAEEAAQLESEKRKAREELQRIQAEARARNEELSRQKADSDRQKAESEKPKPRVYIPPAF